MISTGTDAPTSPPSTSARTPHARAGGGRATASRGARLHARPLGGQRLRRRLQRRRPARGGSRSLGGHLTLLLSAAAGASDSPHCPPCPRGVYSPPSLPPPTSTLTVGWIGAANITSTTSSLCFGDGRAVFLQPAGYVRRLQPERRCRRRLQRRRPHRPRRLERGVADVSVLLGDGRRVRGRASYAVGAHRRAGPSPIQLGRTRRPRHRQPEAGERLRHPGRRPRRVRPDRSLLRYAPRRVTSSPPTSTATGTPTSPRRNDVAGQLPLSRRRARRLRPARNFRRVRARTGSPPPTSTATAARPRRR